MTTEATIVPYVPINEQTTEFNLELFLERFLKNLDIAPDTQKAYRHNIVHFFKWCIKNGLRQPERHHIIEYKNTFRNKAHSTINQHLSAVRQFFKYLDDNNIYSNITKGLKIRSVRNSGSGHSRSPLTKEQSRHLLDSMDTGTLIGKRDYAMINLKLRIGLRDIELYRANIQDMDVKEGRNILYVQRKGHSHKDDWVILTEDSYAPLKAYICSRSIPLLYDETPIPMFVSHGMNHHGTRLSRETIKYVMRSRLRDAELKTKHVTGHSLRHTFATLLLEDGVRAEDIQQIMGHSSINTTIRYTKGRNRINNPVEDRVKI